MSRTDKDRPYWVRVQDEGVVEHNHHANYYRHRNREYTIEKVFDDEGNPVMEDREVKLTAKRVIETQPRMKEVPYTTEVLWGNERDGFYTRLWNGVSKRLANPAYSEAERLVAMGMPEALVVIRIESVQKTEKVYHPTPEGDLCDLEEALADPKHPWSYRCSKEIPYWSRNYYRCRCSWCRPGDEPRQRNRERTFTTAMVKRANSGDEDWEDDFNELDLSQPDMYHRGWC